MEPKPWGSRSFSGEAALGLVSGPTCTYGSWRHHSVAPAIALKLWVWEPHLMTAVGIKALWHLAFEPLAVGVGQGGTLPLSSGCCLWPLSRHGLLPPCSLHYLSFPSMLFHFSPVVSAPRCSLLMSLLLTLLLHPSLPVSARSTQKDHKQARKNAPK